MRRFGKLAIVGIAAVVALTACVGEGTTGGEGGTGTGGGNAGGSGGAVQSQKPAIGTVRYDDRLCEMVYTGTGPILNGWAPYAINGVNYCYVQVGAFKYDAYPSQNVAGAYMPNRAVQPVFQRDFENPAAPGTTQFDVLVIKYYQDGLWRRISKSGAVEILYQPNLQLAGRWVTLADYNAAEAQRLRNQTLAQQQAAAASRQQSAAAVSQLFDRIAKAQSLPLQPDCNWNPPCR